MIKMLGHSRGEEGVERACREMKVLHEAKNPCLRILASLFQAVHHRRFAVIFDAVEFHTAMSKLALLGREPVGR